MVLFFNALNAVLLYFNLVFNKKAVLFKFYILCQCLGMKSELVGVLVD